MSAETCQQVLAMKSLSNDSEQKLPYPQNLTYLKAVLLGNFAYYLCSFRKKDSYGFNILGRKRRSYAFGEHMGEWLYKIGKLTDA